MADVTISALSLSAPNKNTASVPFSDGATTYRTAASGIVAASPGSVLQVLCINNGVTPGVTIGPALNNNVSVIACSIMPKFASSKMLIDTGLMFQREVGTSSNYYEAALWRDEVNLTKFADAALYQSLGNGARDFYATSYLDAPNTTNAITYVIKSQKPVTNDAGYCTACYHGICYMSIKEIAA